MTTSQNGIGHDQEFADHFSQANLFWRSQSPVEQTQIVDAYTFELSKVSSPEIRQRVVGQLVHIAPELADQVAGKLGIDVVPVGPDVPIDDYGIASSPSLSLDAQPKGVIKGRQIAVLVNDGVRDDAIDSLRKLADQQGAVVKIIGPRANAVTTAKGATLPIDHALYSVGSVLFDAVYVPNGDNPPTVPDATALLFVNEAYKHYKAIGAGGTGARLVAAAARAAGLDGGFGGFGGPGVLVTQKDDAASHKGFLEAVGQHRWWDRPDALRVPA